MFYSYAFFVQINVWYGNFPEMGIAFHFVQLLVVLFGEKQKENLHYLISDNSYFP